jgi:hypothetical protein
MTGGYSGSVTSGDPATTSESCEFTGGKWKVDVSTVVPTVPPPPVGAAPLFPGTNLGSSSSVLGTRSGTYSGRYEFYELDGPRRSAVVIVDNNTFGSHTYPATSGPPQRPVTSAATLSIATAVAQSLNSSWAP